MAPTAACPRCLKGMPLLNNRGGGVKWEGHPPTFWLEAQLLAYPYAGGGGGGQPQEAPTHQTTKTT